MTNAAFISKQRKWIANVRFVKKLCLCDMETKEGEQMEHIITERTAIIRMKNKTMLNAALDLQSSEKKKGHSPFD